MTHCAACVRPHLARQAYCFSRRAGTVTPGFIYIPLARATATVGIATEMTQGFVSPRASWCHVPAENKLRVFPVDVRMSAPICLCNHTEKTHTVKKHRPLPPGHILTWHLLNSHWPHLRSPTELTTVMMHRRTDCQLPVHSHRSSQCVAQYFPGMQTIKDNKSLAVNGGDGDQPISIWVNSPFKAWTSKIVNGENQGDPNRIKQSGAENIGGTLPNDINVTFFYTPFRKYWMTFP